jgi:hypothetical protein
MVEAGIVVDTDIVVAIAVVADDVDVCEFVDLAWLLVDCGTNSDGAVGALEMVGAWLIEIDPVTALVIVCWLGVRDIDSDKLVEDGGRFEIWDTNSDNVAGDVETTVYEIVAIDSDKVGEMAMELRVLEVDVDSAPKLTNTFVEFETAGTKGGIHRLRMHRHGTHPLWCCKARWIMQWWLG